MICKLSVKHINGHSSDGLLRSVALVACLMGPLQSQPRPPTGPTSAASASGTGWRAWPPAASCCSTCLSSRRATTRSPKWRRPTPWSPMAARGSWTPSSSAMPAWLTLSTSRHSDGGSRTAADLRPLAGVLRAAAALSLPLPSSPEGLRRHQRSQRSCPPLPRGCQSLMLWTSKPGFEALNLRVCYWLTWTRCRTTTTLWRRSRRRIGSTVMGPAC
mmetsp:Transcript_116650/g.341443  ORF Transcript_116650/g.341443 Transcript_116650/m.341443 type:complete len:216 (+) Transcript_116650:2572-3219(+)